MKNEFDNDLKRLLEEASIEDSGFPPDREKLWQKISQPVVPLLFRPWFRNAAAVAAVVAIGVFLLVNYKDDQPVTNDHRFVTQKPDTPQQQALDTVYAAQEQTNDPVEQEQNLPEIDHKKPFIPTQPKPEAVAVVQDPEQTHTVVVSVVKEEQPVLIAQKATAPSVIHLSDLGNENANPGMKRKEKQPILARFQERTSAVEHTETFTALLADKLNTSKN